MAFKLRHRACCDLCNKEQDVFAYDEEHANVLLERDHGWDAQGNTHVCDSCKETQQTEAKIAS
jgi:hypothetical protein